MKYRGQKNFNLGNFLPDMARTLRYMVEQSIDPDKAFALWYGLFEQLLHVHASIRRRKIKHWLQPEWINQDLLSAVHKRHNLLKARKFNEYKRTAKPC